VLEAETSKRFMSGVQAIGILSLLKTRFERIDGGAAGVKRMWVAFAKRGQFENLPTPGGHSKSAFPRKRTK